MILKNANSIYIFYEIVEQLEPESILDVGMFLKRVGSVSRKIMDREIPKETVLHGVDFFPEVSFPVWNTLYDRITVAESWVAETEQQSYDLALILGIEELQEKIPLGDIVKKTAESTKYLLTDKWLPEWERQKEFLRVLTFSADGEVYFLAEFGR